MKQILIVVVVLASLFVLTNTRVGVWIVFDLVQGGADNVALDSGDGPLHTSAALLPLQRIELPVDIEQASGITVEADRFLVTTDQAELFELDRQAGLRSMTQLLSGPLLLIQGSIEANTLWMDDIVVLGSGRK